LAKKLYIFLVLPLLLVTFPGCGNDTAAGGERITVAVSIVPQETFVRAVAGDHVDVVTLIPPGYSPENYEPSPSIMKKLSDASVFFAIGVPAEDSIIPRIRDFNSRLKIVRLEDEVGKVFPDRYFDDEHTDGIGDKDADGHGHAPGNETSGNGSNGNKTASGGKEERGHVHTGRDPHIWMSPRRVEVIIDVIARELSSLNNEFAGEFGKNAAAYKEELAELDESIKGMFEGVKNRIFIMYHPSLGYFADDYGLKMLSLEKEGKEPSAKEMQVLIDIAENNGIKAIVYQAEMDSSLTEAFASEIGGKSLRVDPLSADYINNLLNIAETLRSVLSDSGG
jgi:zinc transport system substrate-binding protein